MSSEDPGAAPAPQRLYFHVGLPKSGSTYLQSVLGSNRRALRDHGFVYPFVHQEGMFHAAVEMTGKHRRWGLDPELISGTFERLLRRARNVGGTAVLSHEIFGNANDDQIRRLGELLAGFEVHLVVTARDLGRTLTADWQEQVKNGQTRSFAEYTEAILADLPEQPGDPGTFWRSQNLAALLDRWQAVVPPERTHVVVTPGPGADPGDLWLRFADAIGLPPDSVDLDLVPVRNESLGVGQIAFLRHVTVALAGRLEQPWHSLVAKRWFAQSLLSGASSAKPATPPQTARRLAAVSRAWVERLEQGPYSVHGPLAELVPQVAGDDWRDPDDVTDAEMLDGLPEVVAEMLVRVRELREENGHLRDQAHRLEEDLARLRAEEERRAAAPWWRRLR